MVSLPSPSSPAQLALLQATWDLFLGSSRWPTFDELDLYLDRRERLDIVDVAGGLPPGLLIPPDLRYPRGDQEISLTIAGAAACRGSDELIQLFLAAVGLATRIEAGEVGDDARELSVASFDLPDAGVLLPAAGRQTILRQLGLLLGSEPWGRGSYSFGEPVGDPTWRFELRREVRKLRGIEDLQDYWGVTHLDLAPTLRLPDLSPDVGAHIGEAVPTQIFLVYGHDDARHEVARFLEQSTSAKVIILGDEASSGRTVIEKFEAYAEASGFAVVLLTPDDVGRANSEEALHPRARQNVVLELGYFIGKLGRDRVAILNKGVDHPSDVNGVVYISYPGGDWKLQLSRELSAAGLDCDPRQA